MHYLYFSGILPKSISTIINPYLLSYKDAVLIGPNKSIRSSSKGLEIDTMSLDLKDDFTIFPFWHAPQSASE